MRAMTAATLAILVAVTAGAMASAIEGDVGTPGPASTAIARAVEVEAPSPKHPAGAEIAGDDATPGRSPGRDAGTDTLWIFDADFSDLTGDNAGWLSFDRSGTLGSLNYWHKDTIRINGFEWLGDSTWWCGVDTACWRQPRGYGNNWYQLLWRDFPLSTWSAPGDAVVLEFDQRYAMERFYDYGYIDVSTDDGLTWDTITSYNNGGFLGAGVPRDWDFPGVGHQALDFSDYAGSDVRLQFRFESDVAYSSQDQYDNPPQHSVKDGAWQLDNIEWKVNDTQVWLDDCESPGENGWQHPGIAPTGQTGVTFWRGQYGIDFWTGRGFDCDAPPVGTWMYAAVDSTTSKMVDWQRSWLQSPPIDIDGVSRLTGRWHFWLDMPRFTEDIFGLHVTSNDDLECIWAHYGGPWDPNYWYGGPHWFVMTDDWDAFAGNPWLAVAWEALNDRPPEPGIEHMSGIFLNRFRLGVPTGDPGTLWERDVWDQFNDWFDHELGEALLDSASTKVADADDIAWVNLLASNDGGASWDAYACRRPDASGDWWITPPPANQMTSGSEIHYYWEAMDGVGNTSTFPADAPGATFEMSILPILGSIEEPSILLVDKVGGRVPGDDRQYHYSSERYLADALEILGFEFDVYDVEVPSGVILSDGPDAASMEYYDTQIWFFGDLSGLLMTTQDQVHLIDWLAESQEGAERNLLVMGDNLGRYFAQAGNETLVFYSSWLASDYVQDTVGSAIVDSVPTLADWPGGFDFMDYDDAQCRLAGGCPELPRFDVVRPYPGTAGAETVAVYVRDDMTELSAGVAYTHAAMGYQAVTLGFGVEYMVGDGVVLPSGAYPTGIADRVDLIGNIMEYFGKEPTGTPTDAPEASAYVTRLGRVYPNPFNPVTTIEYSLAEHGRVVIRVCNLAGRVLATLVNTELGPGKYDASWDGATDSGEHAASGVYFIHMKTERYEEERKTVLLK